ncbi:MAG: CDGSH iron-sulfur domain-containing protein [Longimicrobiales bacterium]
MADPTITFLENGPIRIDGQCTVVDHGGQAVPVREGKAVFLCRCGLSANKPFCDGTHKTSDFDGTLAPGD